MSRNVSTVDGEEIGSVISPAKMSIGTKARNDKVAAAIKNTLNSKNFIS
jgi:hypothetical protein